MALVACCSLSIWEFWSASWFSFSTIWNCAVWAIIAVVSAGLLGSWYFSWATSSFRKVSLPMAWVPLGAVTPLPDEPASAWVTVMLAAPVAPIGSVILCSLHSQVERCGSGGGGNERAASLTEDSRRGNADGKRLRTRAVALPGVGPAGAHAQRARPQALVLELAAQVRQAVAQGVLRGRVGAVQLDRDLAVAHVDGDLHRSEVVRVQLQLDGVAPVVAPQQRADRREHLLLHRDRHSGGCRCRCRCTGQSRYAGRRHQLPRVHCRGGDRQIGGGGVRTRGDGGCRRRAVRP